MSNLRIAGAVEERKCDGEGCPECPYRVLNDEHFACMLQKGMRDILSADNLWELVDPKKASDIVDKWRDLSSRFEEDDFSVTLPVLELAQYVELIDGLDEPLRRITDADYRLSPEDAEQVMTRAPYLVDTWEEQGRTVYSIARVCRKLNAAIGFLKQALEMGRGVKFG